MNPRNNVILSKLIVLVFSPVQYFRFLTQYFQFKRESKKNIRFNLSWWQQNPFLLEATENTEFDHHYVYHPAWATRIIKKINPIHHVDISSTLHFCSILSSYMPVTFYDYRPAKLLLSNLESKNADLTDLPFDDNSIPSLSCMHTIEHIGLGRYGDPIDPEGDVKAINELKRVLSDQGNLLFVVPIGKKAKINFNSQRIYTYDQIISYFYGLDLIEFSLITDNPKLEDYIENVNPDLVNMCTNACGCFWFKKNKKSIIKRNID